MPRINARLLDRIQDELGLGKSRVYALIDQTARELHLPRHVAAIALAGDRGINISRFASPDDLAMIRQAARPAAEPAAAVLPPAPVASRPRHRRPRHRRRQSPSPIAMAIELLISDDVLKKRCADLLEGKGPYDRAFREATTVLDDRLKKLGGIKGKMNAADVVGKVVSPDPAKAVLVVSDEADEQAGFHAICRGIVLAFRNPAHHELTDNVPQEDALRFCGFVDTLLGMLASARKGTAGDSQSLM